MNPTEINIRRGTVPTARCIDHVAVTVPDLEEAVRFFVEVLGAYLVYVEGPLPPGTWLSENLRVPNGASCRIAMLKFGPTLNLELFEYDVAGQRIEPPLNSDVGGHHLAVYVDDIDAAYNYLQASGRVTFQGRPKMITHGPIEGNRWVYFMTSWGLQLELMSSPPILPYERDSDARKTPPAEGWEPEQMPSRKQIQQPID